MLSNEPEISNENSTININIVSDQTEPVTIEPNNIKYCWVCLISSSLIIIIYGFIRMVL